MTRLNKGSRFLDESTLRIATEVLRQPEYARVFWDFDADTWVVECRACGKPPQVITKEKYQMADKEIKVTLVNRAAQHNHDRHGVS